MPALPPIDATIGISTASATICSMVASNSLMTEEATIAVNRLTNSHENRLDAICRTLSLRLLVADAGQRLDVLVGLLLDHLDDVVDGDDADQPLVLVDDRRRHQVVALELAGDLGLVGGGEHHRPVGVHDLLDLDVPLGAQQSRKLDRRRAP